MKKLIPIIVLILLLSGCTPHIENQKEEPRFQNIVDILLLNIEEQGEAYSKECAPYWNNTFSIGTLYDFDNDGIHDYFIAYPTYSKYFVTIFSGKNLKPIYEICEITEFLPQYITTKIFKSSNNTAFYRSDRYNQTLAADTLIDEVQIDIKDKTFCFEAVYDKNTNNFVHAYDKYKTEEDYLFAQNEILKNYKCDMEITWSQLLNYKDDINVKQAIADILTKQ